MATPLKPCLICGRPFKPCSTYVNGVNWRRTFCSAECYKEWVRRNAVREVKHEEPAPEAPVEVPEETPVVAEEAEPETVKPTRSKIRKKKAEDE